MPHRASWIYKRRSVSCPVSSFELKGRALVRGGIIVPVTAETMRLQPRSNLSAEDEKHLLSSTLFCFHC